jgi:hypothetical protein
MNKIPASLRSDFSDCRFAPECVPVCFGIGGDFSGIRIQREKVAQRRISEKHVLRVIYVEGQKEIAVVTFYPGRRSRYESSV